MEAADFRKHAHEIVDWMADYLEHIRTYPVKSTSAPGAIKAQLPAAAPQTAESFADIFRDFETIIMPGITHWQHPSFFAYFTANSSYPSLLAEMLTATIGAQCMSWQTSPAATELEERVMQWLVAMLGLPPTFCGVIQDTASTATLCALLTARERVSGFAINDNGFTKQPQFCVYCSSEAHSSIEKAVKIAGLGRASLRKIAIDANFALQPAELERAILADQAAGRAPLCVVAALGTTGSTAIDPIAAIAAICQRHAIWLHIDAAYAGTAMLLPEKRYLMAGVEEADSFVFNPHKWMFTNFDCCAYFVKDKESLIRTFEILPEYLKTAESDRVNNYRDWGIQLGRRFRALKLWFVIREYGVAGLQETVRRHIAWAAELAQTIAATTDFELLAPVPFATVCFRYKPRHTVNTEELNALNNRLMETLNATGKMYLTHTKLNGALTLRLVIGQTHVNRDDVQAAWGVIQHTARTLHPDK